MAVSGVLGVALGIGGGLALDHGQATFADPLRLGIPLVNQQCTDDVLLTVARGNSAAQLGNVVAENPDRATSYLNTTKSCDTAWNPQDRPPPRYVVYDGPFGTRAQACDAQFSAGHPGGVVTVLTDGTTDIVHCLCFVSLPRPTMRTTMATDGTSGIWIRQLQRMLADLGLGSVDDISGSYDLTTAAKIREFQRANKRPATGEVDAETWHRLLGRACGP